MMKKISLVLLSFFACFLLSTGIYAKDVATELLGYITDESTIKSDFDIIGLDYKDYPQMYEYYENLKTEEGTYPDYDKPNSGQVVTYEESSPAFDTIDYYKYGISEKVTKKFVFDKWYCIAIAEGYRFNSHSTDLYFYFYNPLYDTPEEVLAVNETDLCKVTSIDFSNIELSFDATMDGEYNTKTYTYEGITRDTCDFYPVTKDLGYSTSLNLNPYVVFKIENYFHKKEIQKREYSFNSLTSCSIQICEDPLNATFSNVISEIDNESITSINYSYDTTILILRDTLIEARSDGDGVHNDLSHACSTLMEFMGGTKLLKDWFSGIDKYGIKLFFYNFDTDKKIDSINWIDIEYNMYFFDYKAGSSGFPKPDSGEFIQKRIVPGKLEYDWVTSTYGSENNIELDYFKVPGEDRMDEFSLTSNFRNITKEHFNYQCSILFDFRPYHDTESLLSYKSKSYGLGLDEFSTPYFKANEMSYNYQGQSYTAKIVSDDTPIQTVPGGDSKKTKSFIERFIEWFLSLTLVQKIFFVIGSLVVIFNLPLIFKGLCKLCVILFVKLPKKIFKKG